MTDTLSERLAGKLTMEGGCLVWTGALLPNGYGQIRDGTRRLYVHRVAYQQAKGPIPFGWEVDHLCRNRACCAPAHLEAVPRRENILRSDCPSARRARQTHCRNGHEFTLANTFITRKNQRQCRTCNRERMRRYNAR